MSEPELAGAAIQKALVENPNLRKKILQRQIFHCWYEIFPKFADKFYPVKIQADILFVDSNDNAFKDMLKFGAEKFVAQINEKISPGFPVIAKIKFAKSFDAPPPVIKKIPAQIETVEIELTAEEIATCEKKVAAVTDDAQRKILLDAMLSYAKSQKRKLQGDWHKCKFCNVLCPPNEIFCNVCAVKERAKMLSAIKKIFLGVPETHFREIQQRIIRQFPHLQTECTLEKIESARMDLILYKAAKISYGDTSSDAAIFLVRLIRQLPLESVTPEIVNSTLQEFRFNLADQPPFKKHEFLKPFPKLKKSSRRIEI